MKRALLLFTLLLAWSANAQDMSISPQCGGADIDGSCKVVQTHLSSPLPNAQGGMGNATGWLKGDFALLGSLRSANFNSTADQAIAINASVTKYLVTGIYVTNCTGSLTIAAGGFYSAAGKSGTIIVGSAQTYSALTGTASQLFNPTLSAAGNTTTLTGANVYLSLTVALGSAATCDVYVVGLDLT